MKIQSLTDTRAIPFYRLKDGELFKLSEYERVTSEHLFLVNQVLMKVDHVGAIDYPYDRILTDENVMFIGEKQLVQVVKKTHKEYKNYVIECEKLLNQMIELGQRIKDESNDRD
jgi:hypothetical protein